MSMVMNFVDGVEMTLLRRILVRRISADGVVISPK